MSLPSLHRTRLATILLPAAVLLAAGCSSSTTPAAPLPVTLTFNARVGSAAFACGSSYTNIGTTGTTITPTDFKMYLSNVRLLRTDGTAVPVTLTQDATWQIDDIAMLDFENGTGACTNGTAPVRTTITGTVEGAAGDFTGLRFTLGVPQARNHADAALAPAPLNQTRMWWSWNGGYKFIRLDVNSTGLSTGWFVHLGSTTCNGASATSIPTSCAQENRPEVSLTGFNPLTTPVIVDVAALLASNNVDANVAGPAGCMSGTTDPECPAIFARLGLPFGNTAASAQSFFRVQ